MHWTGRTSFRDLLAQSIRRRNAVVHKACLTFMLVGLLRHVHCWMDHAALNLHRAGAPEPRRSLALIVVVVLVVATIASRLVH
jgi:hypothetical protein